MKLESLLATIDPLELAKLKHHRCLMASSYDRRGGNHDWSNYIRREGTAAVLFEAEGPGCIQRIWTADPQNGTIRFFFDGEDFPRLECPFSEFFSRFPLSFGIGGERPENYARSRKERLPMGHTSYCPIPFARSCKVTIDPEDDYLYYQINWNEYPVGKPMRSWLPHHQAPNDLLDQVAETWRRCADGASLVDMSGLPTKVFDLLPGEEAVLAKSEGPGALLGFRIRLDPMGHHRNDAHLKENLWLVAHVDDDEPRDPSIRCPLGPFFLDFGQPEPPRSLTIGTDASGECYCCFAMPYQSNLTLKLVNQGVLPASGRVSVGHTSFASPRRDLGRFRATWHMETPFGPDHRDYNGVACRLLNLDGRDNVELLNVRGKGHFVGAAFHADFREAPTDRAAGEGDEMFFIDDDPRLTLYGTGTEDYVNDAWGIRGYNGPLSGDAQVGVSEQGLQIFGHRLHLSDCVPFERHGRFTLEHGTGNNCSGVYRSVAYWYQHPSLTQTKVEERHWESIGKST